ncbi:MAG: TatD family hydrolase [Chromatiaceae bacterium]|nr:TatD family hydrolase [Chromatiaceae bacterium]
MPDLAHPDLIDTHCHIDVAAFDADREQVLGAARVAGVVDLVVPAIAAEGWDGLLALCRRAAPAWPRLHAALGLHPVFLERHREADLVVLERRLGEQPVIAIGEIGLDHALPGLDRAAQQRLFEAQLAIARAARLPVLLHVRKAHEEVLGLLRRHGVRGGIAHAFNGSLEQGLRYLDLGFRLGFGGMLTFARSTRLRRLAERLPLEALVLETDAPDLTVASHQGARNSPAYLPEVLAALAEARGLEPIDVAARTSANARAVLGLAP